MPAADGAGQRNDYFNFTAIAGWLCSAIYQAGFIMVIVLVSVKGRVCHQNQQPGAGVYRNLEQGNMCLVFPLI